MNIQKTLDSLQPYVIGIRYLDGIPLVDVVFKEGWQLPEDTKIQKNKGNEEMNYYMLFSEVAGVGLDELLTFVEKTIKFNIEREKKHELLRTMVNDLKEIFKKNSLSKIKTLKFVFTEEDLVPSFNDFDIDIDDDITIPETITPPVIDELEPIDYVENELEPIEYVEEQKSQGNDKRTNTNQTVSYLDENGEPIMGSEEDAELLEEELRAERNIAILENKRKKSVIKNGNKVELPPKRKMPQIVSTPTSSSGGYCDCGPEDACEKCIDSKY